MNVDFAETSYPHLAGSFANTVDVEQSMIKGRGFIPAYIACNLFVKKGMSPIVAMGSGSDAIPRITQDGRDGDEEPGYITGIRDGVTAGCFSFHFAR